MYSIFKYLLSAFSVLLLSGCASNMGVILGGGSKPNAVLSKNETIAVVHDNEQDRIAHSYLDEVTSALNELGYNAFSYRPVDPRRMPDADYLAVYGLSKSSKDTTYEYGSNGFKIVDTSTCGNSETQPECPKSTLDTTVETVTTVTREFRLWLFSLNVEDTEEHPSPAFYSFAATLDEQCDDNFVYEHLIISAVESLEDVQLRTTGKSIDISECPRKK